MSGQTDTVQPQPLTFRRYKDGDTSIRRLNEKIFKASNTVFKA